jgi:hypothetical protein
MNGLTGAGTLTGDRRRNNMPGFAIFTPKVSINQILNWGHFLILYMSWLSKESNIAQMSERLVFEI